MEISQFFSSILMVYLYLLYLSLYLLRLSIVCFFKVPTTIGGLAFVLAGIIYISAGIRKEKVGDVNTNNSNNMD